MDVWALVQDEILRLIHERTNSVDSNAAAVMKGRIVGHDVMNLVVPSEKLSHRS